MAHKRIEPLLVVLDQISKVAEEEEGDPFSSTFKALRVMQTTSSKFNGGGSPSRDISASSSEYTTPVQSHSTSPTHEHSPPQCKCLVAVLPGNRVMVVGSETASGGRRVAVGQLETVHL